MKENVRKNLQRTLQAASFILILKGAVAGSIATLALFGVAVPIFGIEPSSFNQGGAAGIGAIIGIIAAFRS